MKHKKKKPISIWFEKLIGIRCSECGGKAGFHHYKKCSYYKKGEVNESQVKSGS
jgi:ribosomal protein L32